MFLSIAFVIDACPFILATKVPKSVRSHIASENPKQQEITDNDCIITSCNHPEQQLSLL